MSEPAVAPAVAAVPDLFFRAKIQTTAKQVGADVRFVPLGAFAARAVELGASLAIVDLNAPGDPCAAVAELRRGAPGVRIVAFLSHVQKELAERARAAGADRVLARSAFSDGLGELLRPREGGESPATG